MNRTLLLCFAAITCGPPEEQPGGHPLVALVDGRALTRVDDAGTSQLFTFGEGVAADFVTVMDWDIEGQVIGAVAFLPAGEVLTYEYLLVSTTGEVLFHRLRRESGHPVIHLGVDGSLAVAGDTGFIARADGTVTELGELLPMTPVLASGAVLVSRGPRWQPGAVKSLWRDGALMPLPVDPGTENVHVVLGRALVISEDALVSLEDGRSLRLPEQNMQFVEDLDGLLLLTGEGAVAVVDVEVGRVGVVAGLEKVQKRYRAWSVSLGSRGAVLEGCEVEGKLQLRRTEDLGATWQDVGEPMEPGEDLGMGTWLFPVERGGSVMLSSMTTGYGHFVNARQFVTLTGTQPLVTDSHFVSADSLEGTVDVSPDGQLAATWETGGVVLIDANGTRRTVLSATAPGELRFLRDQ